MIASAIIEELVAEVERFNARARRGLSLSLEAPPEAPKLLDAPESPKRKARGTEDEMRAFAVEIGLPETDGEFFYFKMEGCDWKVGGRPIKCWRSQIRSWKAAKYLPSQKVNGNGFNTPQQQPSGPAMCKL